MPAPGQKRGVTTSHHHARISLKLRDLAQLFNSMDPSPFHERDLDHDAEEFIVTWARELPKRHAFELVIHLTNPPGPESAADVENAVRQYFDSRAAIKKMDLRLLLRQGAISLVIGLIFLVACLSAGRFVGPLTREGLLIAGWVAMWRPLQIYLYDWWPLRADWRILQRLAHIRVRLTPAAGTKPNDPTASATPGRSA